MEGRPAWLARRTCPRPVTDGVEGRRIGDVPRQGVSVDTPKGVQGIAAVRTHVRSERGQDMFQYPEGCSWDCDSYRDVVVKARYSYVPIPRRVFRGLRLHSWLTFPTHMASKLTIEAGQCGFELLRCSSGHVSRPTMPFSRIGAGAI